MSALRRNRFIFGVSLYFLCSGPARAAAGLDGEGSKPSEPRVEGAVSGEAPRFELPPSEIEDDLAGEAAAAAFQASDSGAPEENPAEDPGKADAAQAKTGRSPGFLAAISQGLWAASKNPAAFLNRLFSGSKGLGAKPAPADASLGVPADFGAERGTAISNKDTVLSEIDHVLDRQKPPSIEYLWVAPQSVPRVKAPCGSDSSANPFGHAVIRYALRDGTQRVMNIVGVPGKEMVNFSVPADYLYGTHPLVPEQRGIYNRQMIGLRLENFPQEAVEQLDAYYRKLQTLNEEGLAKFSLALPDVDNFFARMIGSSVRDGNCARWVSSGLASVGILKSPTMWPKRLFVELYETYKAINPDNVHVVVYRHITQAAQLRGGLTDLAGWVTPSLRHFWLNFKYRNLERLADVIVEVPKTRGAIKAEVRRVPK